MQEFIWHSWKEIEIWTSKALNRHVTALRSVHKHFMAPLKLEARVLSEQPDAWKRYRSASVPVIEMIVMTWSTTAVTQRLSGTLKFRFHPVVFQPQLPVDLTSLYPHWDYKCLKVNCNRRTRGEWKQIAAELIFICASAAGLQQKDDFFFVLLSWPCLNWCVKGMHCGVFGPTTQRWEQPGRRSCLIPSTSSGDSGGEAAFVLGLLWKAGLSVFQ